MTSREFVELMSWSRSGVLIVTHRNADVDAVAAAFALEYTLRSYGAEVARACFPEGVDLASKRVLSALGFSIPGREKCDGDKAVLVDVSTAAQLGEARFSRCFLVDHHAVNSLVGVCDRALYDPEAGASSALVAEALMEFGFEVPRSYAALLLAGILSDTRFLRGSNPRLLRVVAWLLERVGSGLDIVVQTLVQQEVPYAERVARLKSLSRMGVYSLGDGLLMTITCVGAYEASSLRAVVDVGSDLALAVAPRKDFARVVLRASSRLLDELKSPVAAELSSHIGSRLGGSGGGHDAAGGAVIPLAAVKELERAIAEFFQLRGYKVRTLEKGRWIEECV